MKISLLCCLFFLIMFTACKNDDPEPDNNSNNNSSNNNNSGSLSDPSSLSEGTGEVRSAGAEKVSFDNAATWKKRGAVTMQDKKTYAITELTIKNQELNQTLSIEFYVSDSTADMFGGKLPEPGNFRVNMSEEEKENDTTKAYAQVSLWGNDLDNFYDANTNSQGLVTITEMKGDTLITGKVNVQKLVDIWADGDPEVDVEVSFKAIRE